jgi:hypothetical protein
MCHIGVLSIPYDCDTALSDKHQGGMFMPYREELMKKIQDQRRFLDELLLDIANLQETASEPAQVTAQALCTRVS